jgi:preprotein translocase subunit SecF
MEEHEAERKAAKASGTKGPGPISRLYNGETSFDFVGRRRWWFLISTIITVLGLASLGFRGLNLGIDFKGGSAWIVAAPGVSQTQAVNAMEAAGLSNPTVELLGTGANQKIEVQADLNALSPARQATISNNVQTSLAHLGKVPSNEVSVTHVGPTWGGQVTQRALVALVVFFIVVAIYISFRFEPKMALAAFIAMVHDLLVTIGVYSLFGFQVTPDTVIAILTILGYSLYDTVVVFDRVRDNTKGFGASGRMTYSEMINLSMNQTLARSINTSLVAILPVLSVLLIGAGLLGATTLQDYGLALTVGLLSGAYSSIFIAAPVLAVMKEREQRYTTIRQRLETRGERVGLLTPSAAAALSGAGAGAAVAVKAGKGARSGTIRPGAAKAGSVPKAGSASKASGRAPAGVPGGAKTATGAGAARPKSNGARGATRPPPRPRKGGKGKSKKRR